MTPDETRQPEPDPTLTEFGARLRRRRDELDVSQETLAADIHMHWTALSRLERGLQTPKLHTILRIARGLETTPGELLDGLPLDDSPVERKPRRRRRPAE